MRSYSSLLHRAANTGYGVFAGSAVWDFRPGSEAGQAGKDGKEMEITQQIEYAQSKCVELFGVVQHTYFRNWVNGKNWKLQVVNDDHPRVFGGKYGYCSQEEKTIFLNGSIVPTLDHDMLEALIIHETTHCLTGGFHGKKFLRRLEKAAEKAMSLGNAAIFNELSFDVKIYKSLPRKGLCRGIYDEINDSIVRDEYSGGFKELLENISKMINKPVPEILVRCTKCESAFNKARRRGYPGNGSGE